jgi:hypothetical protein
VEWNAELTLEKGGVMRSWSLLAGVGWEAKFTEEPNSVSGGRARNKNWRKEWGKKSNSHSESLGDYWANLLGLWTVHKTELPFLVWGGADSQCCSCGVTQLPPSENNTITDHVAQTGSDYSPQS